MRMRRGGLAWWWWALTALALGARLAGWRWGLVVAALLTVARGAQLAAGARRLTTLPVQVRASYLGFLACGAWPPLAPLLWPLLAGTLVLLVFDYCPLARTLSLLPWNRRAPLTLALLRATYLTPPR